MGINSSKRKSYPSGAYLDSGSEYPKDNNPDPNNYQIIKAEEENGYLIVKIKYPNCTNYEGEKILVYKNMTLIKLVNQKIIDPHFFNDNNYASPIARFVPTDFGWEIAQKLIRVIK